MLYFSGEDFTDGDSGNIPDQYRLWFKTSVGRESGPSSSSSEDDMPWTSGQYDKVTAGTKCQGMNKNCGIY